MKRSIKSLILLLALAVLAGGYALVNALMDEDGEVLENEGAFSILDEGASIAALSWSQDGESISLRRNGDVWQLEGDESYPLDQDAVDALADSLVSLTGDIKLEGVEALEDYGLDEPAASVDIELESGETRTLAMGNETLLGGEYYISAGEEGVVYATDVSLNSILSASLTELTLWEEIPSFETASRFVVTGANASLDQTYYEDGGALSYNPDWHWFQTGMQYPSDEDAMRLLLDDVSGFDWNGFVAHGVEGDALAEYGLDEANATTVMVFVDGEAAVSLCIGAACEDGYYAMLAGSDCVYTAAAESVASLLQATDESVRATDVLVMDWEQVTELVFDAGTPLTLVRTETTVPAEPAEDTEEEEASEEPETVVTVTLNGETVDATYAQEAFEDITSLAGDDFVDGMKVSDPLLTITVKLDSQALSEIVLRFGAYNATSYVLENGVQPPMLVSASSVDALIRTWSYMPSPSSADGAE